MFILGCSEPIAEADLIGLWELEEVEIDAVQKRYRPTFIEIKSENRFSLSRTSGDMIGFYGLKGERLKLRSEDDGWFSMEWDIMHFGDHFDIKGIKFGQRGTRLRFRKIAEVPDFQEFENRILGTWQLYRIRKNNKFEKLPNTEFFIDGNGNYRISNEQGTVEEGGAIINTRHRKIIFEGDETTWNAWFYGRELRLDNEDGGIEYSLRRSDR